MDIDEDTIAQRFFIGVCSLIGLLALLLFLGTKTGRGFLVSVIVVIGIIYGLGWTGEVLYEAYEEYY